MSIAPRAITAQGVGDASDAEGLTSDVARVATVGRVISPRRKAFNS